MSSLRRVQYTSKRHSDVILLWKLLTNEEDTWLRKRREANGKENLFSSTDSDIY